MAPHMLFCTLLLGFVLNVHSATIKDIEMNRAARMVNVPVQGYDFAPGMYCRWRTTTTATMMPSKFASESKVFCPVPDFGVNYNISLTLQVNNSNTVPFTYIVAPEVNYVSGPTKGNPEGGDEWIVYLNNCGSSAENPVITYFGQQPIKPRMIYPGYYFLNVPSHVPGNVTVTFAYLLNSGNFSTFKTSFWYIDPSVPQLTGVPPAGPPGFNLPLKGFGFSSDGLCWFNNISSPFNVSTPNYGTCFPPLGLEVNSNRSIFVSVSNAQGVRSNSLPWNFIDTPIVSYTTLPSLGTADTEGIIYLNSATANPLTFFGDVMVRPTQVYETYYFLRVPAHESGPVPVRVSYDGYHFSPWNFTFTYIGTEPVVTDVHPPVSYPGTKLTVNGYNFSPGVRCALSWNSSSFTIRSPAHYISDRQVECLIDVRTPKNMTVYLAILDSNDRSSNNATLWISGVPTINYITPTSSSFNGGTLITVYLMNSYPGSLETPMVCNFGNRTALPKLYYDSYFFVESPPSVAGNVTFTVNYWDAAYNLSNPVNFTYYD